MFLKGEEVKITIPGKPIAKARPRFVRMGKFVKTYNSQETEEGKWLHGVKDQVEEKIEGPIAMVCRFVFPRPKSHFGTGRNSDKLKPSAPVDHIQKPDCDNLVKFACDCLNELAYNDDCQIVQKMAVKRWARPGEDPHTFIEIVEV